MNSYLKSFIIAFICVLGGFLLGSGTFYCLSKKSVSETKYLIDTVVVVKCDTFRYENIRIRDRYIYDTVLINDTVYIKDESRHYVDSTTNYKVDINAVKLCDYSLDIYKVDTLYQIKEKVSYIEDKKPFKQFIGVGIGVGYGGCVNPNSKVIMMEPYVGIHITYGFGYTF